jgi:hypothetical protein
MCRCVQVCCQPTFAAFEDGLLPRITACCSCIGSSAATNIPRPSSSSNSNNTARSGNNSRARKRVWLLSLAFRSVYVACTTLVAVALPFFAVILGLVAALTFYQTGVLYPVLLHSKVFPRKHFVVMLMSGVLLLAAAVIAMVVVGSVAVIVMSASSLSPLKAL